MSFHNSAEDIHLDGTILKANLFNAEGELQEAELDLNDVLGNDNGEKPLYSSPPTINLYLAPMHRGR